MIKYICLNCGVEKELPSTYYTFEGPVMCTSCNQMQYIHIVRGYLEKHCLPGRPLMYMNLIGIPNIPESIQDDIVEAQLCKTVAANKACVVLCRRVVEGICLDKGAIGVTLNDKIQSLHETGFLSANDLIVYHAVRHFGNYGAHIETDLLGEVTPEDAELVLDLIFHLIRQVYEMPAKIDALSRRRTSAPP